ncbi:MAG: family 10 glycosylhydrolase [Candidatus Poribacteria bacterium]|nr:family 10 glycosylhydrolase [Candidatus Poribacteria bacterium]
MEASAHPIPRGDRRVIYVSDPSSIASRYLPDPVSVSDLRHWVDDLADSEIDTFVQEVYTQAWTVYWRGDKFDYDARPQHRRFLRLLDAGVQPLDVLIEQSHRRGLEFIAGFRINDNHAHVSIAQGVGEGGGFIVENPQFQIQESPPGDFYQLSSPLDFTFAEVRDFIFSVMTEVAQRFDVDGLEMCFRDHGYFPPGTGRARQPLMTELVRRIRTMLNEQAAVKGKKLLLGGRVNQTLDECHSQGLDVPTWISEGLIDYVCPQDTMYADFNAPYAEFAALTRASDCMLYPAILPWSSFRARWRLAQEPMTQANRRAMAQNLFGAGADGVSFYNHFEVMHGRGGAHTPFYPMALHDFHDLKTPARILQGRRHYIFDPTWGGHTGFGEDRTATGAIKANKVVLRRSVPNAHGEYVFRVYEDLSQARAVSLLFRGFHMTPADQIAVKINGTPISPDTIRCRDDEIRVDFRGIVDRDSFMSALQVGGSEENAWELLAPAPRRPFSTCWFALKAPPAVYGENRLTIQLIDSDGAAQEDIVIDEIEILVIP